ncbi:MAG TPA: hypothetical protein VMM76_27990 [Pirellulaceae bacterium]|nr:hypothetical protein [Pirellulaceae bacterium]
MGEQRGDANVPLRFSLKRVGCLIAIASFCSAFVPGAAMFIVGATPVAVGFVVLVIGDQQGRQWLVILGACLMAIGLGIGAALMVLTEALGQ